MAVLIEDPGRVTRRQMETWAADFDNWGICDTACFHLFDRTRFAWDQARRWSTSPLAFLPLVEDGARDERNFVKKGVSWALRSMERQGCRARAG